MNTGCQSWLNAHTVSIWMLLRFFQWDAFKSMLLLLIIAFVLQAGDLIPPVSPFVKDLHFRVAHKRLPYLYLCAACRIKKVTSACLCIGVDGP